MATSTDDNAAYGNSAKRNIRLIKADHTRNRSEWFFQKWLINRTFLQNGPDGRKQFVEVQTQEQKLKEQKTEKTKRKQD